ncbi:hypothetical protein [Desulfobotulus mexicanus]|nr:hypothetical protein [Desulfobotulus mexicanus]
MTDEDMGGRGKKRQGIQGILVHFVLPFKLPGVMQGIPIVAFTD